MRSGNKVREWFVKKCCKQINVNDVLNFHNISSGKLIKGDATGILKILALSIHANKLLKYVTVSDFILI